MKRCPACQIFQSKTNYSKLSSAKDGLQYRCKSCFSAWYSKNKENILKKTREYKKRNPHVQRKAKKKWQEGNREKHLASRNAWHSKKYAEDIEYKINMLVRTFLRRTCDAVKSKNVDYASSGVSYTPKDLKLRIEMNFQDGMSWENHGEWHIDHRIPVSIMISRGETRPEVINCLSNLVPMWASDNLAKGARWTG